jgi:hypothetical protein
LDFAPMMALPKGVGRYPFNGPVLDRPLRDPNAPQDDEI